MSTQPAPTLAARQVDIDPWALPGVGQSSMRSSSIPTGVPLYGQSSSLYSGSSYWYTNPTTTSWHSSSASTSGVRAQIAAVSGVDSTNYPPSGSLTGSSAVPSDFNWDGSPQYSSYTSSLNSTGPADAAGTSALDPGEKDHAAKMSTRIGVAVGVAAVIIGLIVGVLCFRRHKRRKSRMTESDMRERGRTDGMGHFDVLHSPADSGLAGYSASSAGNSPIDGPRSGRGQVEMHMAAHSRSFASLVPPPRQFDADARALPLMGTGHTHVRHSSVGGSSTGPYASSASRWEDDSEADMMANDGSTLARTLSTASTGSIESTGTVLGSEAQGQARMDHPGYTYMPRNRNMPQISPITLTPGTTSASLFGSGTGTYLTPLQTQTRADTRAAELGPFADPSLIATHATRSVAASASSPSRYSPTNGSVSSPAGFSPAQYSAPTWTTAPHDAPMPPPPPAAAAAAAPTFVTRTYPSMRTRDLRRLSTMSTSSAGSGISAGTAQTGTTHTTLPEYTFISEAPTLSLSADHSPASATALMSASPFSDAHARADYGVNANPFEDPALPSYAGTIRRAEAAMQGTGMVARDGPPAYTR